MKKSITFIATLLVAGILLLSYDLPKGWYKAGSEPDKYDMGIAKGAGMNGKNAAIIKSKSKKIRGFGTLMQNATPDKYAGKRVRMSGYVKSENVEEWAGLWFRVDGAQKGSLAFDNMYDRHIKGTTPWTKYEIVLDVPESATNLAYGALMGGTGTIWFDDIRFEIVENVPVTGKDINASAKPTNLNFEE